MIPFDQNEEVYLVIGNHDEVTYVQSSLRYIPLHAKRII